MRISRLSKVAAAAWQPYLWLNPPPTKHEILLVHAQYAVVTHLGWRRCEDWICSRIRLAAAHRLLLLVIRPRHGLLQAVAVHLLKK